MRTISKHIHAQPVHYSAVVPLPEEYKHAIWMHFTPKSISHAFCSDSHSSFLLHYDSHGKNDKVYCRRCHLVKRKQGIINWLLTVLQFVSLVVLFVSHSLAGMLPFSATAGNWHYPLNGCDELRLQSILFNYMKIRYLHGCDKMQNWI